MGKREPDITAEIVLEVKPSLADLWRRLAIARRGILEQDVDISVNDKEGMREALQYEKEAMLALVDRGINPNNGSHVSTEDAARFHEFLNEPDPVLEDLEEDEYDSDMDYTDSVTKY